MTLFFFLSFAECHLASGEQSVTGKMDSKEQSLLTLKITNRISCNLLHIYSRTSKARLICELSRIPNRTIFIALCIYIYVCVVNLV